MIKRLTYLATSTGLVLMLSGCIDSVGLQREYVASRDGCREMAEMKMGLYAQPTGFPANEKEKNQMLLGLFSECMRGQDWAVAKPKDAPPRDTPPPKDPATQTASNVPPVGNTLPISSALVRQPAAVPAAPAAPAGTAYMLVPVPAGQVPAQVPPTVSPPTAVTPAPATASPPSPFVAPAPVTQPAKPPAAYTPKRVTPTPPAKSAKPINRNASSGGNALENIIGKE